MSFLDDRQLKGFWLFLCVLSALGILGAALMLSRQDRIVSAALYETEERIASSLLSQGVAAETAARALRSGEGSAEGAALMAALGKEAGKTDKPSAFPLALSCLWLLLPPCSALFLCKRERIVAEAESILNAYLEGDFSRHLPQNREGAMFRLFAGVESLATAQQAQNKAERERKDFLKRSISDISHQLKTPLAALSMYQELLSAEPENAETVRSFCEKTGVSLGRMERLISSMLTLTRLDSGSIVFEKKPCPVYRLAQDAAEELNTRFRLEGKELILCGDSGETLLCDRQWTIEAMTNLIKNALDHTKSGDSVRIGWERSPAMLRITVADSGEGIAPEDIHHIFKRFYRSRRPSDSRGVGLGLSIAKAITEGQGGSLTVQSEPAKGAVFTMSFPMMTEV